MLYVYSVYIPHNNLQVLQQEITIMALEKYTLEWNKNGPEIRKTKKIIITNL